MIDHAEQGMRVAAMTSRMRPLVLAAFIAAQVAVWCGCEVNSTEQGVEITPGSVTLSEGQSQTFTASGGYEYSWSLDPDDGSASLSTRHGDTTVFTLLSNASSSTSDVSVIEVLCASTIPGVSGSDTNTAYTSTDTAYVHVRASDSTE
jgi:hypothetical protein